VVTENLTGELAYVSGARGEMGTLLVGAKNGTKILEWAGRYVAAEGPSLGIAMEAVKGNLPGLHVVTMDKKPVGYVLARSGFVAFSQATQSSLVTLKAILATEGKAVLPDAFAERAGGDVSMAPCTAMMLQDWARQVGGAASAVGLDDALEGVEGTRVKPMTRTLAGNKGSCAAWVVCDAEGLTLRAIW
jgi:hypothetical protein